MDFEAEYASEKSKRETQLNSIMSGTWKSLSKDELVNVNNLSKQDFDAYMEKNFGKELYKEGFEIIKNMLDDDGLDDDDEALAAAI